MKKLFFLLCLILVLTGFTVAQAADSGCSGFESQFSFLSNGSGNDPTAGLPKICTAGSAIAWVTNMALGFAGVIAVVFIIVGGYMYLTSAGNEEGAEKGRKVLTNAIIGLIIIILSATIIRIVVNTLDTDNPSVNSTITYPTSSSTPPSGGGGSTAATAQDKATLKNGFSVTPSQVNFSLPQSSANAIKAACGVQSIGSNVAISGDVGTTSIGSSGLSLAGGNYTGSISLPSGSFNESTDSLYLSVCSTIVSCIGVCQ